MEGPAKPTADGAAGTSWKQRLHDVASDVRDWVAANKLRAIAAVAVASAVLVATLTAWVLLAKQIVESEAPPSLDEALTAWDEHRFSDARQVIRQLQELDRLTPDEYGGPMFVLGAIKASEAEESSSAQKRAATYFIASRYLEKARARGFPPSRGSQGIYLLAKSLVASAQFAKSLPILEEALAANPQRATELHWLFTTAHLGHPTPRLEDALAHVEAFLSDRLLSPADRAAGLLSKGEILLRLGRNSDCRTLIDHLPEDLRGQRKVDILAAQLMWNDAREMPADATDSQAGQTAANQLLQQAIEILRKVEDSSSEDPADTRAAMYLIGLCYATMGPDHADAALDQLGRTRKLHFDSPEGLAASLAEADLLQQLERVDEAIAAYRRTLAAVGEPRAYRNRWLPLAALRSHVLKAHQTLVADGQFEPALVLLEGFVPAISKLETAEKRADTYRSWGESLAALATRLDPRDAPQLRRQARHHFRHAGLIHEEIAKSRFTSRQYTSDLWNAADNYIKGHAFTPASRVLTEYLRYEAVTRRPQALVQLGTVHLSLGNIDRSIRLLQECIELHQHDEAVYQARIICAQAYRENGNVDRARELLLENLNGDELRPVSRQWRESLFELGFILHENGVYEESIDKLTEAVERYPNAEQTVLARYAVADANRKAAEIPIERFQTAQSENERRKHLDIVQQYLGEAANQYRQVQQELTRASAEDDLNELDQAILRNSYMMRGSVLFDLKDYDQALEVFRNASSLYPSDPVVLETYVQIANCHRRMDRQLEARGALEQAKAVLRRIPPDADFLLATNLERNDWQRLLDEMSTW